jgi:hypothetical protein
LQWSVATGSIITDLIHGWARKSQQSGFSLIPVPHDPFALPITKNSDPVRGPIFVVLVIHSFIQPLYLSVFLTFSFPVFLSHSGSARSVCAADHEEF